MSKAQGLPINTIILALLAIFVLIIVIYLAGSKLGQFGTNVDNCQQKGGVCSAPAGADGVTQCSDSNPIKLVGTECDKTKSVCCISIGKA